MRTMKAKKLLALILCTMMVIGTLSACKSSDKGTKDTGNGSTGGYETTFGSKQFDNVTITVMVFDRSNAPSGQTAINNNWTKYVNEKMGEVGIKVEFIAVPRSEELNKINTMMASGTGADVMMSYTGPTVQDFFTRGGTYDLSPYIDGENQAKNLKAYIGKDVLDVGRLPDGKLWAVAARRATTARSNLNIRKDWLDALGLQTPTTIDELYEVMVAFKKNNPDGKNNIIGGNFWTYGAAGPVAHSFLTSVADPMEYAIAYPDNDGGWVYSDPGYVEYLRWLNKLYNEGLIDQEYYVNEDFGQTQKEQFVNGNLGVLEYDVNGNVDTLRGGLLQNLKANEPNAEFVSIAPMKNVNDGQIYNNAYPINGAFLFVPKTCKQPEAAVTYLDWLSTKEGGFTLFHGFEGEHFDYVDGVPVVKDIDHNAKTKDWTRHDLFLVGNQGYYMTNQDFINATSKELPGWENYVLDNYANATAGTVRYAPTFSSPTATAQSANLQTTASTYLVKSITCLPEEFDTTIENFKSELEKYGMKEVLAERREHYEKVFGK